jgi:hypothetical protein
MRPGRLAVQYFSFFLIVSLAAGCGLGTTPHAATPTATSDPYLDAINTAIQQSRSVSTEAADQAEQDMLNVLRDQSGARAAFSDQADAIFLQIDQLRAAGLEAMKTRVIGALGNNPKVASLPASGNYQMRSTVGILMMFGLSTMLPANVMNNRDQNGNAELPVIDGGDPIGSPGEHFSWQATLSGSRLEAKGNITITLAQPFPYSETAEYTLYMDMCPDADGNVPLQFSFNSSVGLLGGGVQLGANSQVTGHVNDDAKLTTWEDRSTFQGARQPIHGVGDNLGTTNNYFEYQMDMTMNTDGSNTPPATGDYTRQSAETDERFNRDAMQSLTFMKGFMTAMAMKFAEEKWTNGYCLEITTPELGADTKTVEPGSSTPFTAHVRHKFEGAELPLPVVATLSTGQASVSPSGSRVPAPAAFTYKAADQGGQTASVSLETRSKRGVAKLDLKFTTGLPTWTGEGTYSKALQQSGVELTTSYTFTIVFHTLPDGMIAGEGVLIRTDAHYGGQGMVCNDIGTSGLIYPPLKVAGLVKPDGTFQLSISNTGSTNTWKFDCMTPAGSFSLDEGRDQGIGLSNIEIASAEGAQADKTNDLSMSIISPFTGATANATGSETWTLQIHKQTVP